MPFWKVPNSSYFVVIKPDSVMPLLCKDSSGEIRSFPGFDLAINTGITPETEVQVVLTKTLKQNPD